MHCRCGPRRQTRFFASDAARVTRSVKSDPTGTAPLQRQFMRDLRTRWQQLRAMIPDAVAHTVHQINSIQIAALTGQDPVVAFQSWIDEAMRQVVLGHNGAWTLNYVRQAGDRATLRAGTLSIVQDAFNPNQPRDDDGQWTRYTRSGRQSETGSDIKSPLKVEDVDLDKLGIRAEDFAALPVEKVRLSTLRTTQDQVNADRVTSMMENSPDSPIHVVNYNGVNYSWDGNHRASAAKLRGDDDIDAKVLRKRDLKDAAPPLDRIPALQSLAIAELQGIVEAVSQRAVRAYVEGMLRRQTPAQIARNIALVIETVGRKRGDMLVSFMIVRAFGAATLDALRSRGITHVGIIPERKPAPPVITDAKAKKKKSKVKNLVGILTAGDDDVCPACEDIAEGAPYTLDEAESLIPAHPRCRCAFVPWDDARFAHDAEWDENEHPRDKNGKFTASNPPTKSEQQVLNSGDDVTRNIKNGSGPVAKFWNDLPLYKQHLNKNTVWEFMQTSKGLATLQINEVYGVDRPTVEMHWLIARDRGAGRSAMEQVTKSADRNNITLQLNPVPLGTSGGEGKTLSKAKLEKFYADFDFKKVGKRDQDGYALMVREPKKKIKDARTHIAAGVMFLDPVGKALFLKRSKTGDHAGEWCFPGGAGEAGETLQSAAKRETLEETGHMAADVEEIDRRELDGVDFTTYASHVPFIFEPKLNREHDAWLWAPLNNPPQPLHPGVRATINRAVVGDEFDPAEHPRHPKGHPDGGKFAKKDAVDKLKAAIVEHNEVMGSQYNEHISLVLPEENIGGKYQLLAFKHKASAAEHLMTVQGLSYTKKPSMGNIVKYDIENAPVESAFDPDPDDMMFEPEPSTAPDPLALKMDDLAKIGGKKGSNEGGVYTNKDGTGDQYYIKTPKTKDHVQNELTAAALYKLAGVNTMDYVPVEGGEHVATIMKPLDKDNVSKFNADERNEAQRDFAVHAWLANWDAAGTGGDNQVVVGGKVATVDTGGSLKYRAQGEPKGDAFGESVTEFESLRDSSKSPDAAALYGNMTPKQLSESIDRVKAIPDGDIIKAVIKNGGTMSLANQLIARKDDLASKGAELKKQFAAPAAVVKVALAAPALPEPKSFPTKMAHAKHLLMKGTTSNELKKALNWPAIGVPATAAQLNLKLEKTKTKGGAFFYKGTPMTQEEIAAKKSGTQTAVVVPIKTPEPKSAFTDPASPHYVTPPAITKAEILGLAPHDNFVQGLAAGNIKPISVGKFGPNSPLYGEHYIIVKPEDTEMADQVAKWHPSIKKFEGGTAGTPLYHTTTNNKPVVPVAPKTPATQGELDKAKKNTKLTAQYVPGAPAGHPEAEALITKFNEKYEGKPLSTNEEMQAKVDDFKQLTAQMVPLQTAQQKIEAEKQVKAQAAADLAKKKANEIPDDFESEEAEQRYWYNKQVGESSYMSKAEALLEGDGAKAKKLKAAGLTAPEIAYIKAFTGSYSHFNAQMTSGVMEPGVLAFKHIMNEALAKMPKFDGDTVWRKITLSAAQIAEYEVGKVKHWAQFSSTSKNSGTWSGNAHFTIKNPQSGVDVEFISSNPSEAEVIMPADTYYKVLSKTQSGGNTHITMEEVTYGKFYKKKKKVA